MRELIIAACALLTGLLLLPMAIYFIGKEVLGDYALGGLWALIGQFFKGLVQGSVSSWILALGPYAALLTARLFAFALRKARPV